MLGTGKTITVGIIAIVIGIIIGFGIDNPIPTETNSNISSSQITEQNPQLAGEITIGLILPLTGDLSTHGEENWAGSKLGISDFNKYLEELGASWNLKMVSEDSATNPVIALEKLTALNAKGIKIILGVEASSNIDDSNQGNAISKLIKNEGIQVIVPVWRGDTWGDGISQSTTESFVERGGMIDEGIRYNPEAPEFSATTSLLSAKVQEHVDQVGADKVAVLFLGFAEILQFMQSAAQHDVLDDVRWFGPGANTKEHKLIDDPIALEFSHNIQFTTVQVAVTKNPTYEWVESTLTSELGRTPNTFVHSSYDIVWIIGLAMLQTESSDVTKIKEIIPNVAKNYYGIKLEISWNFFYSILICFPFFLVVFSPNLSSSVLRNFL
jgi:branched-chain amino acid transport system substrate-binding protein